MARIRYIKPEFYEDTTISEVSIRARYLYIGMWVQLDCQGVCEDNSKFLKAKVFPYDDEVTSQSVEELLNELIGNGRLARFQYEGKNYLYCPKFGLHQNFHRDEKSKYPAPPANLGTSTVPAPYKDDVSTVLTLIDASTSTTGTGTGTGTGTNSVGAADANASALALKSDQKKLKAAAKEEISAKARSFVGSYVTAYKTRFPDGRPEDLHDGKVRGQILNWIKDYPLDRACQLIQVYFQMDTKWFGTKGYDFLTFRNNLNKIGQALDSGKDPDGNAVDWQKMGETVGAV